MSEYNIGVNASTCKDKFETMTVEEYVDYKMTVMEDFGINTGQKLKQMIMDRCPTKTSVDIFCRNYIKEKLA